MPQMIKNFIEIIKPYIWQIICGILIVYILKPKKSVKKKVAVTYMKGEYVMKLIINTDHKMSKGKVIAQIGHAMSGVMKYLFNNNELYKVWKKNGEAKIVLKASGEEIQKMVKAAISKNIFYYMVHDAGRTQVPAGTNTVLVLGPGPKDVLDGIAGELKLY